MSITSFGNRSAQSKSNRKQSLHSLAKNRSILKSPSMQDCLDSEVKARHHSFSNMAKASLFRPDPPYGNSIDVEPRNLEGKTASLSPKILGNSALPLNKYTNYTQIKNVRQSELEGKLLAHHDRLSSHKKDSRSNSNIKRSISREYLDKSSRKSKSSHRSFGISPAHPRKDSAESLMAGVNETFMNGGAVQDSN